MEPPLGDEYDQSIHLLLRQINERREQAAQLAQLVEQSIHVPNDSGTGSPAYNGFILDDVADDRLSNASPPASFLEGFTRDFVEGYQAPEESVVERPGDRRSRFSRMILPARGSPEHRHMLRRLSEHSSDSVHSPDHDDIQDRLSNRGSMHDCRLDCELSTEGDVDSHDEASVAGREQPKTAPRGAAIIDRGARLRLWQRIDANTTPVRDHDETRISAIVALAERIASMQATEPTAAAASPMPPPLPPPALSLLSASEPALLPAPATLPCWSPGEWERWAEFVLDAPSSVGPDDMAARLHWVHEQQSAAWDSGFGDTTLANGKLERTYRDIQLTLQAYRDGNVKRTALVDCMGARMATTLYFANGDWSWTAGGRSCYFYSDERVWHEQTEGKCVYRYADGREERVDADGAMTVRYPSGDVRVIASNAE
ncbi:hypothetical protein IWW55_004809 [Coemansia sp. RSA 2706]|nr:hypothetical protein IWW55_004809 [Coemansia sp. RSA 2706]KAJ2312157.1 hypothetical protein IWW54_002254 [Coemansia sp. RSA 2705]